MVMYLQLVDVQSAVEFLYNPQLLCLL
ncbi:hypothetical protein Zm00014a_025703 [Zea mays]|uniref:Uncharacterized protein n=1 Tax=Zea mays TaxID=4577 RepID=A0A3L6F3M1_MAIZE|nr:hypothetical protein Zm00014a_025703 [Zea mays]